MSYSPAERTRILIASIAASSMGYIDGSVLSILTPAIRTTLDAGLADVQWVSNAYLLTLSSLLLLGGAAGDRFGLRNVFIGGIVLFVVASLASALAPNVGFLIAARAVQGVGAAFMVPGSLAIIAEAYPPNERGRAIGLWASASSLTTLLGPVFGGALLSWLGEGAWRWVFAINLPLGAVALGLLFSVAAQERSSPAKLDAGGAVLATLGLFLVSWGLTEVTSPFALPAVIAGAVVLAGFLFWEARTKAPMLSLGLFRDAKFTGAQSFTFLIYFGLSAVGFYLPMIMIAGWRVTPAEVAIAMLPLGIALTLLSAPAGRLTDRVGPGPVLTVGALIVALSFALLGVTAGLHQVWLGVMPLMILFGIGMSGIAGPISTAVMSAAPVGETGKASAINNAVARVAGLMAIAVMGSLAALVFAGQAGDAGNFGVPVETSEISSALDAQRIAATDLAFAIVAYACAALALGGAVLSWLTLRLGPASSAESRATE